MGIRLASIDWLGDKETEAESRGAQGGRASFNLKFRLDVYLSSVVKVDLSRPVVSNINSAELARALVTRASVL